MGHRTLEPADDKYHDLPAVLEMLRKEFEHVEITGTNSAGTMHLEIRDDKASELSYLGVTLHEAVPIFIGFTSRHHEDATIPLVRRFAKALGYEVMDDPEE